MDSANGSTTASEGKNGVIRKEGRKAQYLNPLSSKIRYRPFAVYDLETTTDLEKVYLVGFYDGSEYRYFESEPKKPQEKGSAVDQFLNWLISTRSRYHKYWLYAHNGGNFDVLYILRWFLENADKYAMEVVPVQSTILCLECYNRNANSDKKYREQWKFIDSYRLMNASLDKIGIAFGLGGKSKISESGNDEDESKAYETLHLNPKRYDYLKRDCTLLYDCLSKFYSLIYDLGGDIGITAPASAMLTYRRKFQTRPYPVNRHIPNCEDNECKGCLHEFVRRGYYGGRVEVYCESFNGMGESVINNGDINSMYPASMLEDMPVEIAGIKEGKIDINTMAKHWQGFIDCTVKVPLDCYLPVLPYRSDNKLIFPVGMFSGIWTTVELLEAIKNGTEILDYRRSIWFKGERVFERYVKHLYQFRDKSRPGYDEALAAIAKLLLNSLYGKMGMVEEREKLWFNPTDDDLIEHELTVIDELGSGVFSEKTEVKATYVIPHIAAWVTALSRVKLFRIMKEFIDAGHKIYYCDTDSIITSAMVSDSKELGALKLASIVKRARFVAPKLYFLETDSKQEIKAKGFSSGFGSPKIDEEYFNRIVDHRQKVQIKRMTKLREGLRNNRDFPKMKIVTKGINSIDEKRIHLGNGETKPRLILEGT